METSSTPPLFRFGIFEADRRTGELRKQGRRLSLPGQPFEILMMLLERPGEVVSRAEIQQRLWSEGTFVDFEHSLNTAINKIRDVLDDSATSPRFIETLARRGYRFIAPVAMADAQLSAVGNKAGEPTDNERYQASAKKSDVAAVTVLTSPAELPEASHDVVRLLFFSLQLMYFSFYVVALARIHVIEQMLAGAITHFDWLVVVLVITAAMGIPTRLYLISAVAFNAPGLREKFLRLFALILPLDAIWALAPFLLMPWIGFGLALASTAILLYAPFAERSLILMGAGRAASRT